MQPRRTVPLVRRPTAPMAQPAPIRAQRNALPARGQNVQPAPKQRTASGISDNFLHRKYFKGGGQVYSPLDPSTGYGPGMCKEAFANYLKLNAYHPYDAKIDNPAGPPVEQLDGVYTWAKDTPDCDPFSRVRYTEGPKTKAWMDQRERNYLTRIAREKESKSAQDAKAVADAKEAKDAEDARIAKSAKDAKDAKDAEDARLAKVVQDAKDTVLIAKHLSEEGIELFKEQNYQQALLAFTHAIKFGEATARSYLLRASAYLELEMYECALQDVTKAFSLSPTQADTTFGHLTLKTIYAALSDISHTRGMHFKKEGKYQDALREFNAEIFFDETRKEKKFRGYFSRALTFELLQDHKNATNDLEICLQLQPENQKLKKLRWNIYNNTGADLLGSGKYQEAIEQFTLAIAADPSEAVSHYGLALAYNNLGNDEQSLAALNKSLQLDSKDRGTITLRGVTLQNLGHKLAAQGKYHEAIVEYNKAIEVLPNFAEIYLGLSHVYSELKNYESALTAVNKCLQLDPNDEDAIHSRETISHNIAGAARIAEAARAAEAARIAEDAKIEAERTAANASKKERIAGLTQRLFHRSSNEDQKPNNPKAEFRSEIGQSLAVAISSSK